MDEFKEKLQDFLDNKCTGDWGNCVECPDSYHKDGACTHPDHPSMQPVNTEFMQAAMVHPTIAKVFHDIRNTYQAAFMVCKTYEDGTKPVVEPNELIAYMKRDLVLMAHAEKTCKECKK